jgi:RNA polymerase sigma-70 factor (ECF subfamily)
VTAAYVKSDEELIAAIGKGSRAAFELLFERYREPVWRFFRRRTRSPQVAEELAQDTFLAVLEGASRYTHRSVFRSYLFGIAYNVLLAERRKATHRTTGSLETEPMDLEPFDPDPGIWVRDALATLDEDEREILMLREYEQLSYQEIADVRGTPLNTVRSHLFRARLALKAALETRAPEGVRTTHGDR